MAGSLLDVLAGSGAPQQSLPPAQVPAAQPAPGIAALIEQLMRRSPNQGVPAVMSDVREYHRDPETGRFAPKSDKS